MEEMRRRLNTEEVEEPPADENSQSDSQTSSVEGLYGAISGGRTSHPFKVVDHDALSLQSGVSIGGRMGRLPGGSSSNHSTAPNASSSSSSGQQIPAQEISTGGSNLSPIVQSATISNRTSEVVATTDAVPCSSMSSKSEISSSNFRRSESFVLEPDIVTSHKDKSGSGGEVTDSVQMKAPVAPPRRKRKGFGPASSSSRLDELASSGDCRSKGNTPEPFAVLPRQMSRGKESFDDGASVRSYSTSTPPSPTVSIRSMCREMDRQLESPSQKFWIVKAQDEEKTRAKNAGPKALRRTESLPKDVIAAFDPSGSGSGGQREKDASSQSRSNSNSNSSTLNNTSQVSNVVETSAVSVSALVPAAIAASSGSNGKAPGNQQLSTIISALAAFEERKDAEGQLDISMSLRTRTDSGKLLSDLEILEQVQVSPILKRSICIIYLLITSVYLILFRSISILTLINVV